MVRYPISIRRNSYRGAGPKKQRKAADENRVAADIEKKINNILLAQTRPIQVYHYYEIAELIGYDVETVSRLGYSIDAGSGGFTACRHDLTYAQAIAAQAALSSPIPSSSD